MSRLNRTVRRLAEREAAKRGLSVSWDISSRHARLTLSREGRQRHVTVAGTPRSRDNQRDWIVQDVRRLDRELR